MRHKLILTILGILAVMMVATACASTANNELDERDDDMQLVFEQGTIISISDSGDRWLVTQYDENDGKIRIDAISFRITEQTIFENADGKPLTASDFYVGQQVKAWAKGEIAESFPEQGTAGKIELLPPGLTTTPISKVKAIQLALHSDTSAVTYALKAVNLNEATGEWLVEFVDIMRRERISKFYVDADNGDVVREAVAENEVFRIFTPVPQEEAPQIFLVTGEARVYEATFEWMLEDGHNILASGIVTADQAAPEWGKFEFEVSYDNASNPTLSLIFHVSSAENGEIEHQLIIPLKTPEGLIERHS